MSIMYFFANLFGYVLNFLYELIGNYGVAIILFSILVKLVTMPLTIKQQKTMKKSAKIQEEMKQIQFKYKNDPEKMNQEVMALYKRENMSPFSGCLSSILQIVLLLSVFFLVRSPLTYMVKMDSEVISKLDSIVKSEQPSTNRYAEIEIIQYVRNLKSDSSVEENDNNEEFNINDYKDQVNLNMDFLGIDLSAVPTQDLTNWRTLVIPILYVLTSFISIRMTTAMQNKKQKKDNLITDGNEDDKTEEYNPMEQANKSMSWFMPLMSISIAIIAPLGLALYWLMNNVLMIIERIVLDKVLKEEEEAKTNA
ncbi:MAG: YidC/Oxa1 family membrane protein insertase [Clostridia bacterium]|nr:YidC/Oxa1 family membrane protein insertase [Clostridia bacterium]